MSSKPKYIFFLLEGKKREPQIFKRLAADFFADSTYVPIYISVENPIYSLYEKVTQHGLIDAKGLLQMYAKSDTLELIKRLDRDDISRIYMFFDYDLQSMKGDAEKTDQKLTEILSLFSDATNLGKLYLSYPMVEAIRDFVEGTCNTYTSPSCTATPNKINSYKEDTSKIKEHAHTGRYGELWDQMMENFLMRIGCLFDYGKVPTYSLYKSDVSPQKIYLKQRKKYINLNRDEPTEIFILSGIPEFLLDYFGLDFWKKHVSCKTIKFNSCPQKISDGQL